MKYVCRGGKKIFPSILLGSWPGLCNKRQGLSVGPKISKAYSLLVNLKHNSGNFKCRKRKKTSCPNRQLLNSDKILRHRNLSEGRQTGSLSSYVAGDVVIPDGHPWSKRPFKVKPRQSKLKSGTCIPKKKKKKRKEKEKEKKKNFQGLHCPHLLPWFLF